LLRSEQFLLYSQIGLLLIVSTSLSYVHGISDGLKDADIETRFSVVNVIMKDGDGLKQLRLYEKTDIDYRFISEDGVEYIIPNNKIEMIIHLVKEPENGVKLSPNEISKQDEKQK